MMQREIVTEKVRKKPYVIRIEMLGTTRSSTTMSFEKRVRILPIGFESKKTTLALRILFAISWWMFDVLRMRTLKMVTSRRTASTKAAQSSEIIVPG